MPEDVLIVLFYVVFYLALCFWAGSITSIYYEFLYKQIKNKAEDGHFTVRMNDLLRAETILFMALNEWDRGKEEIPDWVSKALNYFRYSSARDYYEEVYEDEEELAHRDGPPVENKGREPRGQETGTASMS